MALVPSKVLSTRPIDEALAEVAQRVVDAGDELPRTAGIDLLARRLPRLRGGGPLPGVGVGPTRHVDAIEAALLATDDSYLAVQGPPGTGKTYVASRVIARLVLEHGWAVGVTSQGHKAIENVLRAVVAAGVPPEQVGKATRDPEGATWTTLAKADDLAEFAAGPRAGRPGLRRRRHRLGPHQHPSGSAAASSTSSSSTRPGSSPSRRPSPARWPVTGCCCSATPSSCRRCRRAPTPTPSTPPRSAG